MDEQNMQSGPPKKSGIVKWIVGIIVLALVVWGVIATQKKEAKQNQTAQTPTQAETYKIGVIAALSGDAADYGETARNVLTISSEEINNSGGINGKKVDLIYEDGKCTGQDGATAAQKLVSVDKVQVILGGTCSSETLAAVPIVAAQKVLLFSSLASSPDLTGISPYFFRNHPSDAYQGKVLAETAYNKKGWKKVAVLSEQTDFTQGIYKVFKQTFENLGGTVVNENFVTDTKDLRSSLTKLQAAKPDALLLNANSPVSGQVALTQLNDLKWKTPLMAIDVIMGNPKLLSDYKSLTEGMIGAEFGVDPANPKFEHLLDVYKQKYGKDLIVQSYMQNVYDSLYIIKDGIQAVGLNGEKLAAWSRTIKDWDGASGKVTIDANGDRAGGHKPEIIKDGKVIPFTE